ncbi:hypothetical protein F8S13_25570 [Chloroflexia bacterium SDU3-3]|nr:hypothetical protein F8S13_25570 [Chloroflexia bacterium SDU3-3]
MSYLAARMWLAGSSQGAYMPPLSSEQFITRMKLRELQAQRDQLQRAYDEIAQRAAAAPDDAARIRTLYAGLQALMFAGEPFHPDVKNLGMLLHDIEAGRASDEAVAFWRGRLDQELARGRLRADVVYLFGALLDEWAERRDMLPDLPERRDILAGMLERAQQPSFAAIDHALLDDIFGFLVADRPAMAKAVAEAIGEHLNTRVEPDEARDVLWQIRHDPSRHAALREEAQRVVESDLLLKEFADALTILIGQRHTWEWSAEGTPAQARWLRTKWRLFLDDDLPNACLLEVLGARWHLVLSIVFGDTLKLRQARLQRLEELDAPQVIIDNERRLLGADPGVRAVLTHDIWDEADGDEDARSSSIVQQRIQAFGRVRSAWREQGYNGSGYTSAMPMALALINAELQLGRAAFPDSPVYVVKLDLKDYYPSLSHDLVLSILRRLGLPDRELAFFQRYTQARVQSGGAALVAQRGLPNTRQLSDVLGDLVLRLLDVHIQRSARVMLVRTMDDICLIAAAPDEALRAWHAAQGFCAACGLELNMAKCGAVALGGDLPPGLPAGDVTWQMLALGQDGEWRVNQPALDSFLRQSAWRVGQATALLSKIELYNQQLGLLGQLVALAAPLGQQHRRSVDAALARYRAEVLGGDAAQALAAELPRRFLGGQQGAAVSEAWLHWPITAGGLGLLHPTLLAQPYAQAYAEHAPAAPTAPRQRDWARANNLWSRFYFKLLDAVDQTIPEQQTVMESLVEDFIARGKELSDGQQDGLSAYWRWVLYTYGPQILDSFGTFRFLETALVPQHLILQRSLADTESSVLLALAPPAQV